jgi:hypothetical protein
VHKSMQSRMLEIALKPFRRRCPTSQRLMCGWELTWLLADESPAKLKKKKKKSRSPRMCRSARRNRDGLKVILDRLVLWAGWFFFNYLFF